MQTEDFPAGRSLGRHAYRGGAVTGPAAGAAVGQPQLWNASAVIALCAQTKALAFASFIGDWPDETG